jgi:hypothetical protein
MTILNTSGTVISGTFLLTDNPSTSFTILSGALVTLGSTIEVYVPNQVTFIIIPASFELTGNGIGFSASNFESFGFFDPTIQQTIDWYRLTNNLNTFAIDYYPYHAFKISPDLVGGVHSV